MLLLAIVSTALSAHRHNGNGHDRFDICVVENCHITEAHYHNGVNYAGHYFNDGHNWHQLCAVNNCVEYGVHKHSGHHYFSKE